MDQRQPMRELVTDRELTSACTLTTKVYEYTLLAPEKAQKLKQQLPRGRLWKCNDRSEFPQPIRIDSLVQLCSYGWDIVTAAHWENINTSNDYMGVILVNEKEKLLLLAHRGMQTDSIPNIANCLNIALDRFVPIAQDAVKMCQVAIHLIATQYRRFTLCHTGFSMGGFLAQITASACHHKYSKHNEAICYDPPGADHAINHFKWKDNRPNIMIYLTSPNLVNTGKPHYGYVRQIVQWCDKNEYEGRLRALTVDNPFILSVHKLLTSESSVITDCSVKSHSYLFNETHSPFNAKNNFDFLPVQTWPIADNNFKYKQADTMALNISKPNSVTEFLVNLGNLYAENQVKQVANEAGIPDIESVSHQILNPQIKYSDVPILHGTASIIQPKDVENFTPVYSSLFATETPIQSNVNAKLRGFTHYFEKARRGDPKAQYNVGVCYDNGNGVAKDDKKAFEYYQMSASQGYVSALYNLGMCYKNGEGVEKNVNMAIKYFELAAQQGDLEAQARWEELTLSPYPQKNLAPK